MPTIGRSSPKYPMTQSELQQLARILSRNLPVDTEETTYVRAYYAGDGAPHIDYGAVKITKSKPGTRAYGAAGEKADAERKNEASHA